MNLDAGTARLLTAWTPLGHVPPEQGSLLVAAGSHRLPAFAPLRGCYGQSQASKHLEWLCRSRQRVTDMSCCDSHRPPPSCPTEVTAALSS